jgi:hypothetical protein
MSHLVMADRLQPQRTLRAGCGSPSTYNSASGIKRGGATLQAHWSRWWWLRHHVTSTPVGGR